MIVMRTYVPRCRYGTMMGVIVVGVGAATAAVQADEPGQPYVNEEIGISLTLPGADWELSDRSQGIAKVLVFSPDPDGPPYRLRSELLVRGARGQTRRYPVTLNADETTVELDCPFEHAEVVLDPDDKLLKEMVVKSGGSGR